MSLAWFCTGNADASAPLLTSQHDLTPCLEALVLRVPLSLFAVLIMLAYCVLPACVEEDQRAPGAHGRGRRRGEFESVVRDSGDVRGDDDDGERRVRSGGRACCGEAVCGCVRGVRSGWLVTRAVRGGRLRVALVCVAVVLAVGEWVAYEVRVVRGVRPFVTVGLLFEAVAWLAVLGTVFFLVHAHAVAYTHLKGFRLDSAKAQARATPIVVFVVANALVAIKFAQSAALRYGEDDRKGHNTEGKRDDLIVLVIACVRVLVEVAVAYLFVRTPLCTDDDVDTAHARETGHHDVYSQLPEAAGDVDEGALWQRVLAQAQAEQLSGDPFAAAAVVQAARDARARMGLGGGERTSHLSNVRATVSSFLTLNVQNRMVVKYAVRVTVTGGGYVYAAPADGHGSAASSAPQRSAAVLGQEESQQHTVWRRFRDFVVFHERLRTLVPDFPDTLPPKQLKPDLERRRLALNQYIAQVLNHMRDLELDLRHVYQGSAGVEDAVAALQTFLQIEPDDRDEDTILDARSMPPIDRSMDLSLRPAGALLERSASLGSLPPITAAALSHSPERDALLSPTGSWSGSESAMSAPGREPLSPLGEDGEQGTDLPVFNVTNVTVPSITRGQIGGSVAGLGGGYSASPPDAGASLKRIFANTFTIIVESGSESWVTRKRFDALLTLREILQQTYHRLTIPVLPVLVHAPDARAEMELRRRHAEAFLQGLLENPQFAEDSSILAFLQPTSATSRRLSFQVPPSPPQARRKKRSSRNKSSRHAGSTGGTEDVVFERPRGESSSEGEASSGDELDSGSSEITESDLENDLDVTITRWRWTGELPRKPFIVYDIKVEQRGEAGAPARSWELVRRFKDIAKMHKALRQDIAAGSLDADQAAVVELPRLPRRAQGTAPTRQMLETRAQQLEAYLNTCLTLPFHHRYIVVDFLQPRE